MSLRPRSAWTLKFGLPLWFAADHAEDFERDALVKVPFLDSHRHQQARHEQKVSVL